MSESTAEIQEVRVGEMRVVGVDITIEDCVKIVWKMTVATILVSAPIGFIVYLMILNARGSCLGCDW